MITKTVASFTDAWIETPDTIRLYAPGKSHLLQMRGLKHFLSYLISTANIVASFTDAWIETGSLICIFSNRNVASFTDAWIETGPRE